MSPCCNKASVDESTFLIDVVKETYSKQAREGVDRAYAEHVATAFGYSADELSSIPAGAHMGLSCGNPIAKASIKEGETVVDLGSGGGIDVFLAAGKVGPTGQVVGIDNSDDMISRARRNAAAKALKPPHVAFVKASLEGDLPIESGSVDCVLSNCVVNLLPPEGKRKVLKEAYRILKPGGRISLDDIIAVKPYPDSLRSNMAAYVGCISGAMLIEEYQALMKDAGFTDSIFTENPSDLNAYLNEGSSSVTSGLAGIGDLNQWAKPFQIYATKSDNFDLIAVPDSVPRTALKNWWDAYPIPASSPDSLECAEVADLVRNPELSEKDFVVVDVRRNDHAGGHVRGSVQQPAQTFYDNLPEFYEAYKETKQVIFYCGSSNGRGPRCAKWYQDYLDQQRNTESKAFVMTGGAKKWLSTYKEQECLVAFD